MRWQRCDPQRIYKEASLLKKLALWERASFMTAIEMMFTQFSSIMIKSEFGKHQHRLFFSS